MLDLKDDDHPSKRTSPTRPLTRLENDQAWVILAAFVVWLPIYLVWVRGAFNRAVFRYIDSYPALLHLFPIIAVPCLIALGYGRVARGWPRYR
jgi:hypothetical protein